MKIILVVALAVGTCLAVDKAHLTPEQQAKILGYSMECIMQSGVNPELVAKAKQGNFSNDDNFKKFVLCLFQKTGILSKDGQLNIDIALSKLPKDVDKEAVRKVLEECKTKTGKDAADTAYKVFKCYHKATPTHIAF